MNLLKIVLFAICTLVVSVSEAADDAKVITTIQATREQGNASTQVLEVTLNDGTRCVVVRAFGNNGVAITCDWERKK